MHLHIFWDSWSQNTTSKILKHGLSDFLGLPVAEHNVDNLKNKLSDFLGLPVAEHSVDNLKK